MTNVIPFEQPTMTPLDYALKYAAIGWHVFPIWGGDGQGSCRCGHPFTCKSPGKHPVSHLANSGQDSATTDPEVIKRWWTTMPDAGIAVFLAPSGLMAIDIDPRNGGLDTIEAIEAQHGALVSDVLAYTQGGGEHRVFSHRDGVLPGRLGPGVDVKRNGYICVEPTQGVNGRYSWEASSDPLEGAIPSPLPDWLRDLAAKAPDKGNTTGAERLANPQGLRHATAGQIKELREALTFIYSDERDTWIRFGMALHPLGQTGFDLWDEWSKTSVKYDPVDQIRTWRSFKPSAINFESIFYAAQQEGWVNPLAGSTPAPVPAIVAQEPPPMQIDNTTQSPVFKLPGALGMVQDWINATSRKPQPAFATQAALAFGATVLGRRYTTTQNNWPSLYFLNIGKSASGKEHGKWALETLLEACKLDRLIGPAGYTSESGLLSALHKAPSHLAVIDEFGKYLEGASIKQGSRAYSTLKALMESWARCDGVLRPQGYSTFGLSSQEIAKLEERSVRNPALTILAMSTPESFFEAVGSAAARDGFLNRFLIVESDIGRQAGRFTEQIQVPQEIIDWTHRVRYQTGVVNPDLNPGVTPETKVIPFSKPALELFHDFSTECIHLMDEYEQHGLSEMFGRSAEIAMKLSLVIAIGCEAAVIDEDHALFAVQYVRHHGKRTTERLILAVADSEFEATFNQVLELIKKAGQVGMTVRDLHKCSRRFRALDINGQNRLLATMVSSVDVSLVQYLPPSGRGKPRSAYVFGADTVTT